MDNMRRRNAASLRRRRRQPASRSSAVRASASRLPRPQLLARTAVRQHRSGAGRAAPARFRCARAATTRAAGPSRSGRRAHLALLRPALGLRDDHDLRIARGDSRCMPGSAPGPSSPCPLPPPCGPARSRTADPAEMRACSGAGRDRASALACFAAAGSSWMAAAATADAPPPVVARARVPEAWRVLLVTDRGHEGLSGHARAGRIRDAAADARRRAPG